MTVSMQPCPDNGFLIVGAYSPYVPEGWNIKLEVGQDEHPVIVPREVVEAAMKTVFPELTASIRALVVALSDADADVGFKYRWELDKKKIDPDTLQGSIKYLRNFLGFQIKKEK